MNTKFTYSLGWALCAGGTLGGAVYGIYLGKQGNAQREKENVLLKADMVKELERIAEKRRESGKSMGLFSKGFFFHTYVI